MSRSSSAYERELKGLLQGEREAVDRYSRSLEPADRETLRRASRSPFLVVRAAGSLGFDLVALRNEFAFPVEVKASSHDTIHFTAASGRAAEQLEEHRKSVERVGLIVLYAYRMVGYRAGDPWRIFAAPTQAPSGRLGVLQQRLPQVDQTRQGNAVLRWNDGMPLVRFLERISFLTERPAAGAGP
ncbi:MAG TPA: Holliday junction resolvase [Thermoplasmata archaeon]|nr:Holliday junction resolvase [Thermoplasmata archaeon]